MFGMIFKLTNQQVICVATLLLVLFLLTEVGVTSDVLIGRRDEVKRIAPLVHLRIRIVKSESHNDDPIAVPLMTGGIDQHVESSKDRNDFDLPFSLSNDCTNIFLDLGANTGQELRTLFFDNEPESFWAQKFNEYFGHDVYERRKSVCVVAAEPDPRFEFALENVEAELASLGIRSKILRKPVWVDNSMLTLNFSPVSSQDRAQSPMTESSTPTTITLQGLQLSKLLSQVPSAPTVLMKLDLRGEEHKVLSNIFLEGTICSVDYFAVEVHAARADFETLKRKVDMLKQLLLNSKWCKNIVGTTTKIL